MESAKDRLKKMTAWDTVPELTSEELDELLLAASVMDAAGVTPESEDWEPTYDLNSAAANGWLVKAGRAANTTETEPDAVYVTSKVFDNCMRMMKIFSTKNAVSVRVVDSG